MIKNIYISIDEYENFNSEMATSIKTSICSI